MDALEATIKSKSSELEQSLTQLDNYQRQIQEVRKRIIQEEQQLRLVLAPTYLPHDRDKAITEQQVRFVFIIFLFVFLFISLVRSSLYTVLHVEEKKQKISVEFSWPILVDLVEFI